MSIEDENVALIREGYRRWAESGGTSVDHWLELAGDGIVLHALGKPRGMQLIGKAALRAYLAAVNENWQMRAYEVAETIAQGERVVPIVDSTWRNRHTGETSDLRMVNIWRMRSGKAIEFAEIYDTAPALAAARSPHR